MKERKLRLTMPALLLALLTSPNARALHCSELFNKGGGTMRIYPDAESVSSAHIARILPNLQDITQPPPRELSENSFVPPASSPPPGPDSPNTEFLIFDHRGAPFTQNPKRLEVKGFRNGAENSVKESEVGETGSRQLGPSNHVHQLIFGDPQERMMVLKLKTDEELVGSVELGSVYLLASIQTERQIGFGKEEIHTITLYLLSDDGYAHKVFALPPGSPRPKTARFLLEPDGDLFLWMDSSVLKLRLVKNKS